MDLNSPCENTVKVTPNFDRFGAFSKASCEKLNTVQCCTYTRCLRALYRWTMVYHQAIQHDAVRYVFVILLQWLQCLSNTSAYHLHVHRVLCSLIVHLVLDSGSGKGTWSVGR